MAKMKVQGLREALVRLDVISDLENAVAVQKVMLESAKMVSDEARDNIDERDSDPWKPKRITLGERTFDIKPGDLKESVQELVIKGRGGARVSITGVAKIAFLKAPHAWFLEHGFTLRNGEQYPPEGFFRRAVQTMRRPVSAYIKSGIGSLLREYSTADPDVLFSRHKRK